MFPVIGQENQTAALASKTKKNQIEKKKKLLCYETKQ